VCVWPVKSLWKSVEIIKYVIMTPIIYLKTAMSGKCQYLL
jgi:hypothetical protein